MNEIMLKHEENAFKRELHEILKQKCLEFKERTGHRINGVYLEYRAKPKNPPLTLGFENKGLFECDPDIENS